MAIRDLRQTHTYAVMEVSRATFEEIRAKLEDAGYQHAIILERGIKTLDMHGIGLEMEVQRPDGNRSLS